MGRGNSREGGGALLSTEVVYSRDMGRGNSREGFHLLLLSTEGAYRRDMGRGNSREGGRGGRGRDLAFQEVAVDRLRGGRGGRVPVCCQLTGFVPGRESGYKTGTFR